MPRICSRCWLVTVAKVQMVLTDPDINKHSAQVWAIFVLELHIPHNLSSVGVCKGRILMDLMAKDKKRNNITMQLLNVLSRTIRVAFSNAQYPSRILSTFKNRIELSPHPPQCTPFLPYPRRHYADRVSGGDILYPPAKRTDILRNRRQWYRDS